MSKNLFEQMTHKEKVRLLYKTVLRLHRGLPAELRDLGDKYVQDEFRRHKNCKPMEAQLFMTEWAKYAATLTEQIGIRGKPKDTIGDDLDQSTVQTLKEDQVVQLYELMLAAKGLDGDKITPEDLNKK